jgi:diguanylate cyclase (GGDEF)-like protein
MAAAAVPYRRPLLLGATAVYAAVFFSFLFWETPGLGIAHFYYLSIALVALATGPRMGCVAGAFATALYALDVLIDPRISASEVPTAATALRLVTYCGIGILIGWFARDNRRLVAQLRVLAERDFLTGLPNTRAFEAAINRRLDARQPFSLLLGDMDRLKRINEELGYTEGNDALQSLAELLGTTLGPDDELARVGGDEFAVLTGVRSTEEVARFCAKLEGTLSDAGVAITFGWAVCPQEGENALSLYRIADERLYARKLLRGERRGNTIPFPLTGSPRELAG